MIHDTIEHVRAVLHASMLGHVPLLARFTDDAIDLLTGPLTGLRTRYYWVFVAQSVLFAAIVYVLRGGLAPGGGLRGFIRFCFPRHFFTHPSTITDYKLNVANQFFAVFFNLLWRLNTAFFTGWLLAALVWSFGPAPHWLGWSFPLLLAFTVLMTAGSDFGFYVFHYVAHKTPTLWAFHKVHHSAEILTPLVAGRVHPVEVAIANPCRSAGVALVLAPATYLFAGEANLLTFFGLDLVATIFGFFGNQLLHSHLRISWGPRIERVIMSPAQHQIHHSVARHHWDTNLGGVFSLWDWMFGTLYLPRADEQITFGVAEGVAQMHTGLVSAYLLPFWEAIPWHHHLAARLAPVLRRQRTRLAEGEAPPAMAAAQPGLPSEG